MLLKKKLFTIFIIVALYLLLFVPHTFAVTQKQLDVGQAIANFARDTAKNYSSDFIYTYKYNVDSEGEKKEETRVDGIYMTCNYLGIKYSGLTFGDVTHPGINSRFESKFALYCAGYTKFSVYHALGALSPSNKYYVPNAKYEDLIPGDSIVIGDPSNYTGHVAIYVDDAEDDDPNTFRVAEAGGRLEGVQFKEYDLVKDNIVFRSIRRVRPEVAETISYNILNSSTALYDKLDHTKPTVVSVNVKPKTGELNLIAQDSKPNHIENNSDVKNAVARRSIYDPLEEPANSGIVAYQVTKSDVEPTTNWISVEKTDSLNITTKSVGSNGTYYVWVLDVGGNTNYKDVLVSGVDFDTTPPTLGIPNIKEYDDRIVIEILGATDSSGISEYTFYLNGNEVITQSQNTYVYRNLQESTKYTLKYKIVDSVGNSAISQDIPITTSETKITEHYSITQNFISRIKNQVTSQKFIENINDKVQGKVYTKAGQKLGDLELVGTGMELRTTKGNYTIIVTGDVTGDGRITSTDILKLKRSLVNLETFDKVSSIALDVNYSDSLSITDLLKLKQAFIGLIDLD